MHADTDNEENNFWQKLSYGILERHRRYTRTCAHFMMHKSFEEIKMFNLKLYIQKSSDCSYLQRMGERLLETKHLLEELM